MRTTFQGVLGVLTVLVASGCNRNRPVTDIDPNLATVLVVENQSFPDMTIYALEGARKVRLGLANGHSTTRFTLPKHLVRSFASIRFLADPIGSSRTPVSDEIAIIPGDEVVLRIPPS